MTVEPDRRQLILRAAVRIFARDGLAAAKIAAIAREAGLSYGLVYYYFPTKEAIFAAILEQAEADAHRLWGAVAARGGSAWDRFAWLTQTLIATLRAQPEDMMVFVQALSSAAMDSQLRARAWRTNTLSWTYLRDLMALAQSEGTMITGDPAQLASIFWSFTNGLAVLATFPGETQPGFPDAARLLSLFRITAHLDARPERMTP